MATKRSPKSEHMHHVLRDAEEVALDVNDVKNSLKEYVDVYGGDPEQTEYMLAAASLNQVTILMKIVEDNVRELGRRAHLEDLEGAKAEATE